MMHCSDKARALCSDRDYCGRQERGDFTADSWCGGFNAGVAKATETAIDLEPLISCVKRLAEILADMRLQDPKFKAALAKMKEESDAGT